MESALSGLADRQARAFVASVTLALDGGTLAILKGQG